MFVFEGFGFVWVCVCLCSVGVLMVLCFVCWIFWDGCVCVIVLMFCVFSVYVLCLWYGMYVCGFRYCVVC